MTHKMTRFYGRIACSIWDNQEFLALSPGAQRTYFMLMSQDNVTPCGTLPLTVRRWAKTVSPDYRDELPKWLEELSASRFIAYDEDTEELLIRTFVKWDGGFTNSKRIPAIHSASIALRSPILCPILAAEMVKCELVPQFRYNPDVVPGESPIDRPSDSLSDTLSDSHRVVFESVTTSTSTLKPETGNRKPKNARNAPARSLEFDSFWSIYPRKVSKETARKAWTKAIARVDHEVILAAVSRMANDPNLPEMQYIKHPATWLNAGGWEDEPFPPPINGDRKPNATAVRRSEAFAVVNQLRARYSPDEFERPQLGAQPWPSSPTKPDYS